MKEKIKHDSWVYKNVDGIEYRGKYISYGWTYAEFILEKQIYIQKRSFFGFGKLKKIPKWELIINSHLLPKWRVINKSLYYDLKETEKLFDDCISQSCFLHKNRFENKSQKRDRIINEILK